jgi:hypothetical protein
MIFGVKSWIFTRYTPKLFSPPLMLILFHFNKCIVNVYLYCFLFPVSLEHSIHSKMFFLMFLINDINQNASLLRRYCRKNMRCFVYFKLDYIMNSNRHDITEILLKVALSTIKQTDKSCLWEDHLTKHIHNFVVNIVDLNQFISLNTIKDSRFILGYFDWPIRALHPIHCCVGIAGKIWGVFV